MIKSIMVFALIFNFISMAQDSSECKGYYSILGKYEQRKYNKLQEI